MPAQKNSSLGKKSGNAKVQIVECGVDWLTVTCKEPAFWEKFQSLAAVLIHEESDRGNTVAPTNMLGFEGLKCGGVAYGAVDGMSLMRLSSYMAQRHWLEAYQLSTNCSRIDLQVTVGPVAKPKKFILKHGYESRKFFSTWRKPPHVDIRDSNVDAPTVYYNKRVSDRFGRIYDKFDESKMVHYEGCVRFECQFNGKCAKLMAQTLGGLSDDANHVTPRVHRFFSERGCSLTWPSVQAGALPAARRRSDAYKRLSWLSKQVRPCISSLIDSGFRDDVMIALGLEDGAVVQEDGPTQKKEE